MPERTGSNIATAGLVVTLAAAAGFVDVVAYLTLAHVFVAHMTGNASRLGIALGHARLGQAAPFAVAGGGFAAGIVAGTVLADRRRAWLALVVEAGLVVVFMAVGSATVTHGQIENSGAFYGLIVCATAALGLQTAAVPIRTTFVTGVLSDLSGGITRRLALRQPDDTPLARLAAVLVAYLVGATLAAVGLPRLDLWVLAAPAAALLLAALRVRTRSE